MAYGSEVLVVRRASPKAGTGAGHWPTLRYRRRIVRPNHAVNTDAPVSGLAAASAGGGAPVTLVR